MKLVNLAANFNHSDGSPVDRDIARLFSKTAITNNSVFFGQLSSWDLRRRQDIVASNLTLVYTSLNLYLSVRTLADNVDSKLNHEAN